MICLTSYILEEGFNPESFINLHDYTELDGFLELVKRIDTDNVLHKKYIDAPIFVDNKLPDYYDFEYTLSFLEKIIESAMKQSLKFHLPKLNPLISFNDFVNKDLPIPLLPDINNELPNVLLFMFSKRDLKSSSKPIRLLISIN